MAVSLALVSVFLVLFARYESIHATDKRLVLESESNILHELLELRSEVTLMKSASSSQYKELSSTINTLSQTVSQLQNSDSGSTYVRWGRTSCSGNGTDLVYAGFAAGSHYGLKGGAANYVCLAPDPQWGFYEDSVVSAAQISGVEYELGDMHADGGSKYFGKNVGDEDAPCAVCHSKRAAMIMIPGRLDCYTGWTREYAGYLMAGYRFQDAPSEYVCVDKNPEVVAGGHPDQEGKFFYLTEGHCGSLKCPPYVEGRELTCVVCTK